MRVKIKALSYMTKAGETLMPYASADLPLEEAREVLAAGVADVEGWDSIADDGGPEADTDADGLPKGDSLSGDGPPPEPPMREDDGDVEPGSAGKPRRGRPPARGK